MRLIAQLVLEEAYEPFLARALAAERAGFGAILVPDHFYTGGPRLSGSGIGESWTSIAAIAARTERIRIGGGVHCNPFRHPCLTAQTAATVDQISGGRLELGLGAGWLAEEFRQTGIAFPRPSQRIRMLDEALSIILPALAGEIVHLDGEYYKVDDFRLQPAALQKPRPPLHIGGGGNRILRVAARHADIVSLIPPATSGAIDPVMVGRFTANHFRERVRFVREAAELAGRDPDAIEIVAFAALCRITDSTTETAEAIRRTAAFLNVEEDLLREHPLALIGTSEEIVAALQKRQQEWGASAYMLSGPTLETVDRFGKEIIPHLS